MGELRKTSTPLSAQRGCVLHSGLSENVASRVVIAEIALQSTKRTGLLVKISNTAFIYLLY